MCSARFLPCLVPLAVGCGVALAAVGGTAPEPTRLTRDGGQEIYTVDAAGGNVKRLTSEAAFDNNPAWAPDGKSLAFASSRSGNFEIYKMGAGGEQVVRLTNHPSLDYWPTWSPGGKHI